MRVSVLGSGSRGNATLVESGDCAVLVDAGFSGRDLERRIRHLGRSPEDVSGIVLTHEHSDHTRGAGVFARRHATPIHLTETTRGALGRLLKGGERLVLYRPGRAFSIGPLRIEPFLTVHDAADPVALTVVDPESGLKVGVATDLGRPTAQIRHALKDVDLLVLEANYDEGMLRTGPYPWSVKSRIASSHGHLSNQAAARLAVELMTPRLAGIVLAHLSSECNRPALARQVVGGALSDAGYRGLLDLADQERPTEWIDVAELRLRSGPSQYSLF